MESRFKRIAKSQYRGTVIEFLRFTPDNIPEIVERLKGSPFAIYFTLEEFVAKWGENPGTYFWIGDKPKFAIQRAPSYGVELCDKTWIGFHVGVNSPFAQAWRSQESIKELTAKNNFINRLRYGTT